MADETREFWCWEDSGQGKRWEAGLWDADWPTETFTTGEALPPGVIASLGTFHNQPGKDHRFALRMWSVPQGWLPVVWVPFRDVRYNPDEGREFTVRGECGIIYHRTSDTEPIMVKLECPDGDGAGLYRVYSWWTCVKRPWRRTDNGWVRA